MTDEAKALVAPDMIDLFRIIRRAGRSDRAKAEALADFMQLIETQAREIERLREVGAGAWVPAEQFVKLRKALEKAAEFIGNTKHSKAGQKAYQAVIAALAGDSHDQ